MKKIYIILTIFAVLTTLSYQNCSKPMSFSSPSSNIGSGNPDIPPPDDTPIGEDDDIIEDCRTASLLISEQNIKFNNNRDTTSPSIQNNIGGRCEWGMNNNEIYKSNVNDTFTARVEESKNISLPAGAKICDMEFEFKENPGFKYDDHIFMALNDRILMSTAKAIVNGNNEPQDIGGRTEYISGVFLWDGSGYIYDWTKLKNKMYSFSKTDIYCNGSASTCIMPKTTSGGGVNGGKMKLDIAKSVIQSIRLMTEGTNPNYTFKVIVGGDNDNASYGDGQDCSHHDIELKVKTTYYLE